MVQALGEGYHQESARDTGQHVGCRELYAGMSLVN